MGQPPAQRIYVPQHPGALTRLHGILEGSGIVASAERDVVRVDYEGARYGQDQFARFAERVKHAHGRHVWNEGKGYPTVARIWLEPSFPRGFRACR